MADRPPLLLGFDPAGCPDCGTRRVALPPPPVTVTDDFDWTARDFEGFRRTMLESLASDSPDRARWSEADLEVALVELLAAALDRMSHALDVSFAERFLATAVWPRSVVRHLTMIDGVSPAVAALRPLMSARDLTRFGFDDPGLSDAETLLRVLTAYPQLIETAKTAGLAGVTRIEALVSAADVRRFLETVPAFAQVMVRHAIEGGITTYEAAALMRDSGLRLHDRVSELPPAGTEEFVAFFKTARGRLSPPASSAFSSGSVLDLLDDTAIQVLSVRTAVLHLAGPLLPLSTRLRLADGRRVGVALRLCVEVEPTYFRSEVQMAVRQVLSAEPGGFFEQTNFGFGAPLYLSDLQAALMALDGVRGVIVSSLRLVNDPASEATGTGVLVPPPNHALTLDADNPGPGTGYYTLKLSGGLIG